MAQGKTTVMDAQEEIVRLLTIQLRRQNESQTETIRELGKAGFGPARIAQLLGTTPGTVSQALHDAKAKGAKSGKATSDTA